MGHVNALLGASSGAWSPAALSGLWAWFDPSDPGSRTLSGSTVTALSDKTGNGYDLTATGVGGPSLTATIGARTGMTYTAGQILKRSGVSLGSTSRVSIAAVFRAATSGLGSYQSAPALITNGNAGAPLDQWDTNVFMGAYGPIPPSTGAWLPLRTLTTASVGVWTAINVGTSRTITQHLGATLYGTVTGPTDWPWGTSGALTLGSRDDSVTSWAGDTGEVLIWTGGDDTDRLNATTYLTNRWGIA